MPKLSKREYIEQEIALLDDIVQKNEINAIKMLIDTKENRDIEQIATVLCNFLLPYKSDLNHIYLQKLTNITYWWCFQVVKNSQ